VCLVFFCDWVCGFWLKACFGFVVRGGWVCWGVVFVVCCVVSVFFLWGLVFYCGVLLCCYFLGLGFFFIGCFVLFLSGDMMVFCVNVFC